MSPELAYNKTVGHHYDGTTVVDIEGEPGHRAFLFPEGGHTWHLYEFSIQKLFLKNVTLRMPDGRRIPIVEEIVITRENLEEILSGLLSAKTQATEMTNIIAGE